jgi:hypothetical protein
MKTIRTMRYFVVLAGLAIVQAQFPPRTDDHFWRKKVVITLDLREKINVPLESGQEGYQLYTNYSTDPITDKSPYSNREGFIVALVKAFKEGKFVGFDPKNLSRQMTFEEFDSYSRRIEQGGGEDAGAQEGGGMDEMGGEEFDSGEFMDEGMDVEGGAGEGTAADASSRTPSSKDAFPYIKYYRTLARFIEDRIFDKNKSDMYYDIQYLCLVRVDPKGALPDEDAVCFRYKDVMDVMDDTQWRNRANDAEDRSVREIIELRRFSSYVTIVSGDVVSTLNQAELRRQQMIEFEHHLWTY